MSTTGSFINMMMQNSAPEAPKVGMGATRLCWTDREPYTIIAIRSPKRIVVQEDNAKRLDKNGMSESQVYEFAPNPMGERVVLSLRKDGRWKRMGTNEVFLVGHRAKYHDYSF